MRCLLLAIMGVSSACSGGAKAVLAPVVTDASPALAAGDELDYRAPFDRAARTDLHVKALALLVDRCRAGSSDACWRAAMLHRHGFVRGRANDSAEQLRLLVTAIAGHCVAGDDMSCRVLAGPSALAELLLGHHAEDECKRGVAAACLALALETTDEDRRARKSDRQSFLSPSELARRNEWLERGCELGDAQSCHQLHTPEGEAKAIALAGAECGRGWVESCWLLHDIHGDHGDVPDAQPVWQAAARSCRDGVIADCGRTLDDLAPAATKIAALAQLCSTLGAGCSMLGALRLAPGGDHDAATARAAYEQGCQVGDDFTCLDLAERYLDKTLAEPMAGRGRELAAYLCALPESSWNLAVYNGMPFAHRREHASEIACRLRDAAPKP